MLVWADDSAARRGSCRKRPTSAIGWHRIFFINLPVGLLTWVFTLRLVEDRPGVGVRAGADIPSAVLLISGLMLGVYTIVQVSAHGWTSIQTLALGTVAVSAFLVRQAHVAKSLMPLRLLASRTVAAANFTMALLAAAMFAVSFLDDDHRAGAHRGRPAAVRQHPRCTPATSPLSCRPLSCSAPIPAEAGVATS